MSAAVNQTFSELVNRVSEAVAPIQIARRIKNVFHQQLWTASVEKVSESIVFSTVSMSMSVWRKSAVMELFVKIQSVVIFVLKTKMFRLHP